MKDGLIYTAIVILGILVVQFGGFIFPAMSDEECFQDEYGRLHNNNCPYKSVPWFTQKQGKMNLLIEKGTTFCAECFSNSDVEKCVYCHMLNLEELESRYYNSEYSQEYIENSLSQYDEDYDKDISRWYY